MSLAETVAAAWCGVAIACDARTRRIPNVLTLGAIGVAILSFMLVGRSPLGEPWATSATTGAAVGIVAFGMFGAGRLGAGDVKFMAALPLVGGPPRAIIAFCIGSAILLTWFAALHVPVVARQLARLQYLAAHDVPLAVPFGFGFLTAIWCLR
jgi:Flp pilus assembly protein protease CpaA